jgi:hypothetical protein
MVNSCECGNEPSGSINEGNLLAEEMLASQEGLCSMELVGWLVNSCLLLICFLAFSFCSLFPSF